MAIIRVKGRQPTSILEGSLITGDTDDGALTFLWEGIGGVFLGIDHLKGRGSYLKRRLLFPPNRQSQNVTAGMNSRKEVDITGSIERLSLHQKRGETCRVVGGRHGEGGVVKGDPPGGKKRNPAIEGGKAVVREGDDSWSGCATGKP